MKLRVLIAALAGLASASSAAPPQTQPSPPTATGDDAAQMLAYYPPAARAAGVEGRALLGCQTTEHARLYGCVVLGESPSGAGFGQAALAVAALSRDNPQAHTPSNLRTGSVQFDFHLAPPSIEPDILQPRSDILMATAAHFAERPTLRRLVYPREANRAGITGRVVLDCILNRDGAMRSCIAAQEAPVGWDFGSAAIAFAATFKMKPRLVDGEPRDGVHVLIPVSFAPNP